MTAPPTLAQELKPRVEALESERTTYWQVTVTAVHKATSTYDGLVANVGLVEGLQARPHFLPKVGDVLRLPANGPVLGFEPGRIGEGAIGDEELAQPVKEQITTAYETANGKNKVFFSFDSATASTPGTQDGDLWFQRDIFGLGNIVGTWEWTGGAWSPRVFHDNVLNSLTVGKLVGGTGTFDMLMAGSIYSAASGSRYRIDATGIKLWSGSNTTPTVDLSAITGNATFRGTVEGALIRTSSEGQRLEIQGGGAAGGRTLTFYPAGAGTPATVRSRDDAAGNAGITMESGGANRGFVNFTSTFADIGYVYGAGGGSFVRVSDDLYAVAINVLGGRRMAITTDGKIDYFNGETRWAQLSQADGLQSISKFSAPTFSFGLTPGGTDADVYALRFISTNPGSTGGFIYFSDRRLKRNVRNATFDALAEVLATPVREFEWEATGERSFGFVAQEVPADVQVRLSPERPIDGVDNPVGVASEQMMAKLVKAVQQLNEKVDRLGLGGLL